MNPLVIEPGATLGVLGGGQLGAMFATAARRMGYVIAVWDPDLEAPAHRIADYSLVRPFTDADARTEFTQRVRAVTYEWENVPADLCEQLERDLPVRPSSRVLRVIQDRIEQKTFLRTHGLAVPTFSTLSSPDELGRQTMPPYPLVCKTATAGYDGKGQWKILRAEDCPAVQQELDRSMRPGSRWILEEWLPFEREVSVLVVRGVDGASRTYPVVENVHEGGILRQTTVPADVTASVSVQVATMAEEAVRALDGVGVFCVELFLMSDGRVLINEVAPRPHNSGHYSLDACTVSQFEQQVRTLCGLPLGEIRLLSPAVMLNLIGDEVRLATAAPAAQELLGEPGAVVHLYGKRVIRPKRKMGHVSFLASTRAEALTKAASFRARLASPSW
ncbi:MAG: 5-(carboxyamino)imidazole ribonucleotide synthase [Nitrospira sp.]|nr:5-(carboxyamino)imidazole ribonucleotide synthase [Nitrospira sp.]MBS0174492.1 5-(carboxyamino)imidazole ribonucleotide synthase [Nitrospira sp.]MCW5779414.1 5-(carboxyamino)imidazole ribonucleotide synthase [Nitrospira sp.]MCW5796764.1 5-(carboxyamino)imidazole ribonucleotide synthase [Nitrospira sp.]HNL87590.1 5-(carboxyamino)imidazole ribonucleotide synthase [Nitrospira sp.]